MKNCVILIIVLLTIIIACKKTGTKPAIPKKGCSINKITDNQYHMNFLVYYDANGNPALFGTSQITYDDQNRLAKMQYDASKDGGIRIEFAYNGNESFPSVGTYFIGTQVGEILNFTYDATGKIVKLEQKYPVSGQVQTWAINYDAKGNVTNITEASASAPIFTASTYDDKPNFANANPWMKYILLSPPQQASYYLNRYLLFSENNATEWSLNDIFETFVEPHMHSYYLYNANGYAAKDSTVFGGGLIDVQNNSFTCP